MARVFLEKATTSEIKISDVHRFESLSQRKIRRYPLGKVAHERLGLDLHVGPGTLAVLHHRRKKLLELGLTGKG